MLGFMRGGTKPPPAEEEDPLVFQPIARPGNNGEGTPNGSRNGHGGGAAATPNRGGSGTVIGAGQSPAINTKTVDMLLARVQTSSVPSDRREALEELGAIPKLAQHIHGDNVAMLLHVLRMHMEDAEVVAGILEIFVGITEEPPVGSKQPPVVDPMTRESFLHEMLDVAVFLTVLKLDSFWPRYHAVQLLTRLNDYDMSALQKQLIDCNGVTALVDVLNDNSNGGALRNEGLILVSSLTMTNTDIQSILAFNSGFESLFQIITEEGGVGGDVIVKDCLMIIQNIIRLNKAGQKMFRSMGHASALVPVLVGVFEEPPLPLASEIVHTAVSVLSSLVRGEDSNGESVAVRDALCHSGVTQGLLAVALSKQLESFASIEALRLLDLLIKGSKKIADPLLTVTLQVYPVVVKGNPEGKKVPLNGVLGLLQLALNDTDATRQTSAMACLGRLIEFGQLSAASFLTRGFSGTVEQQGSKGQCGQLLASAIFSRTGSSNVSAKYNAARLLYHCVMQPQVADQLLSLPMGDPAAGQTLLPFYVRHLETVIKERQTDLGTLSALLRPLFAWLRYSAKAILIFLNEENNFNFFATWSTQTRDPLHVQLLCATVAVLACAMCPAELPPTVRVTRNGLFEQLHKVVGVRRYADLYYNVSTTSEWQSAPSGEAVMTLSSPSIYDKPFIALISELHEYVQSILQSMTATPTTATAPAATSEGGSSPQQAQQQASSSTDAVAASSPATNDADAAAETPRPKEVSPPQPAGADGSNHSTHTSVSPGSDVNVSASTNAPSPAPVVGDPTSTGSPGTSGDNVVGTSETPQPTSKTEVEATPVAMAATHDGAASAAAAAAANAEALAMIERLQKELAAKDAALQQAQQDVVALKATHESELNTLTSSISQQHNLELSATKDETSRLSAQVIDLEGQLHASSAKDAATIEELRAQLEEAQNEREELLILVAEIDEEKEVFRTQFEGLSTIKKPLQGHADDGDDSIMIHQE